MKYILLDPELNQGAISTGKKSIEPHEERLGAAEWSKRWTGGGRGEKDRIVAGSSPVQAATLTLVWGGELSV